MKKAYDYLEVKDPILIIGLGIISTLAVVNTLEMGYIMGLIISIILIISHLIMFILPKNLSHNGKFFISLVINAIFVMGINLFLQNYAEDLLPFLSIYLPLVVINFGIYMTNFLSSSIQKFSTYITSVLKIVLGYTAFLTILGFLREFLGSNTITLMDKISHFTGYIAKYEVLPKNDIIPNTFFVSPAGALLLLGLGLGIIIGLRKERVK